MRVCQGIEFENGGPVLISNLIKENMNGMDVSVLMGANVANEGAPRGGTRAGLGWRGAWWRQGRGWRREWGWGWGLGWRWGSRVLGRFAGGSEGSLSPSEGCGGPGP